MAIGRIQKGAGMWPHTGDVMVDRWGRGHHPWPVGLRLLEANK